MALSRLKHGFESRWGRHFILRVLDSSQVIERVGGYGGSNKLFSVERDTITEEQLLEPLLLSERRLHPQRYRPTARLYPGRVGFALAPGLTCTPLWTPEGASHQAGR